MTAYYNENDPRAAEWLRNLILWGAIAPGEVDERSIEDVRPGDLRGFTQCHFFAGIGGWSYALRLAGWPDERPVWTGSCPCQPFSGAGKRAGFADERHLWPAWFHLLRVVRPQRVFGEQVATALTWLDLISGDLEGEGYAIGASIVGAHSVGAPHIRQRIYWLADSTGKRRIGELALLRPEETGRKPRDILETAGSGAISELADTECNAREPGWSSVKPRESVGAPSARPSVEPRRRSVPSELGISAGGGRARLWNQPAHSESVPAGTIYCRDEKWRPIEPGTFPLAHGVPGRVGLLRGYGNAIVPQVAAAFIEASMM